MITRIVKLTFQPEKVSEFLKLFEATKSQIAAFEGCESLQLMKAEGSDNVFFTVSEWQAASYLEAYRKSDFFTDLWNNTKIHFAAQPEAWSLETVA
jgi:quinol monooxygenase YgiN